MKMEDKKPSLEEVFSPCGVAVVGASPTGNTAFVRGLQEAGFPAIYPVNPNHTEVLGLPCYPSLQAIPGVVDHVVVSIPAESALALLDDCAAKGVRSVHFFTAGFGETGQKERTELERLMLEKARAGGFRIIGPNCMGLFVPKSHLSNAAFGKPLEPGTIAFISQSGGNAHDLPFHARPRGLRFSKIVSYGNALDVDESELLQYLAQDPETDIIGAYIEGIKDGRHFLEALKKAAARKPVVIYKGGTTEAGRRAAYGHTASLTSSAAVFDALCRQLNIIQIDDMEELVDVVVTLRFASPLPRGTGVAVVGTGGGATVLAGDEIEKAGLRLPPLPQEIGTELREFLPLAGSIFGNPLDARSLMSVEGVSAILNRLGKLPEIHMFVYHLGFHPASHWSSGRLSSNLLQLTNALLEAKRSTGKPVLLALRRPPDIVGTQNFLAAQEAFSGAGLPVFYSARQLAKAMARVVTWHQARNSGGGETAD
ncbi:MAG TPA: acetyl-CoA synthetase [Dehalococcoidia bacterium]|nr:acetyl-CoA synthetase [Dehalococcoidia bacterium]